MSLLLHGIVRARDPIRFGQESHDSTEELTLVTAGELAVVATPVPEDVSLSEEDAVRHLDVLVEVVRHHPVLPLRFGTVAPDEGSVHAEVLEAPIAAEFQEHLDAVEDLVELRLTFTLHEDMLQVLFDEDADLRAIAAQTGHESGVSDRIELGRIVAERLSAKRADLVASWMEALDGLVEKTMSVAASEEGWEQVALLAQRERLGRVDAAVTALVKSVGVKAHVEYVGPLPIYSFGPVEAMEEAMRPVDSGSTAESSRWGW